MVLVYFHGFALVIEEIAVVAESLVLFKPAEAARMTYVGTADLRLTTTRVVRIDTVKPMARAQCSSSD